MRARAVAGWEIGIDEVGRGALAGPVTVAAVMLPVAARGRAVHLPFRSLKDSKKLSAPRREFWAREIANASDARFCVARVYPRGIERSNISIAANRAALRAFLRLSKDRALPANARVYLDGGLYLGSKARQRVLAAGMPKIPGIRVETVVKADEKFPAVAAASIIAKVSRDRFMARLAGRHPAYGFEIHKGYGTAAHFRAIAKHGPCAAHRLTFLGKRPMMRK